MNVSIERIEQTFQLLDSWEDRYSYITELGNKLPELGEEAKRSENLVQGCMSQVWVDAHLDNEGRVRYVANSDTAVVRGIVAIILAAFDGKRPEEANSFDADELFTRLGIYDHLSPNRHVGVYAMIERVKALARGLQATEAE